MSWKWKRRGVVEARRGVESAERGVVDAERALVEAEADVLRRKSEVPGPEAEARARDEALLGVRKAQDSLASAQQALADLLAPSDTSEMAALVESFRHDVDDAAARLAELEATTGVWLPAGELIFLSRLPVRVDLLTAERGSTVSGSFMTVTGSELAVRGSVPERDVESVREGGEARIEDRRLATPISGTIRLVERRAGTRGLASDRHYPGDGGRRHPRRLGGTQRQGRHPRGRHRRSRAGGAGSGFVGHCQRGRQGGGGATGRLHPFRDGGARSVHRRACGGDAGRRRSAGW